MVYADLRALVEGVQRLQSRFAPHDPVVQEMVKTSVAMAETYLDGQPGVTEEDPHLQILKNLQLD